MRELYLSLIFEDGGGAEVGEGQIRANFHILKEVIAIPNMPWIQ